MSIRNLINSNIEQSGKPWCNVKVNEFLAEKNTVFLGNNIFTADGPFPGGTTINYATIANLNVTERFDITGNITINSDIDMQNHKITGLLPGTNPNDAATVSQIIAGSSTWGSITGTLSNQTDLQNALNAKLNLSGGTMTGNIAMGANRITNLADPIGSQDAATRIYVDNNIPVLEWGNITGTLSDQTDLQNALDAKLDLAGGTMTGALSMGSQNLNDVTAINGNIGNDININADQNLVLNADSGIIYLAKELNANNNKVIGLLDPDTLDNSEAVNYGFFYNHSLQHNILYWNGGESITDLDTKVSPGWYVMIGPSLITLTSDYQTTQDNISVVGMTSNYANSGVNNFGGSYNFTIVNNNFNFYYINFDCPVILDGSVNPGNMYCSFTKCTFGKGIQVINGHSPNFIDCNFSYSAGTALDIQDSSCSIYNNDNVTSISGDLVINNCQNFSAVAISMQKDVTIDGTTSNVYIKDSSFGNGSANFNINNSGGGAFVFDTCTFSDTINISSNLDAVSCFIVFVNCPLFSTIVNNMTNTGNSYLVLNNGCSNLKFTSYPFTPDIVSLYGERVLLNGFLVGQNLSTSLFYNLQEINSFNQMRADGDVGNFKITNLGNPVSGTDGANKNYVDNNLSDYLKRNGTNAMTAPLDFGNFRGINLASPSDPTDAVNKNYVDNLSTASAKAACVAATTANFSATYNNGTLGVGATLTGTVFDVFTIDTYTPGLNDRVLIKNQTTDLQNGIYTVTTLGVFGVNAPVLTRATDFDQAGDIQIGNTVLIINGGVNLGLIYYQTVFQNPDVIGTDPINFSNVQFSNPGYLVNVNNLSDVANVTTARGNLSAAKSGVNTDIISISLNNTGLKIQDSSASNYLSIIDNEVLTADRTLSIKLNDVSRILELTGNCVLSGTNTGDQTITLTGNVTGSGTGSFSTTIASGVITSSQINASAGILGTQIANTTITASNIANSTITTTQIASGTITGSNIASTTITASNIVSGTITNTQVSASAAIALSKIDVTSGSANGDMSMNSNKITNLATPVASTDAVNKSYVDGISGIQTSYVVISGSTSSGIPNILSAPTSTSIAFATSPNIIVVYPDNSTETITSLSNVTIAVDGTYKILKEKGNATAIATTNTITESIIAPVGPATGDYWVNISIFPYVPAKWSGSAWVTTQFVKIGECTKVGASLTPTTYAYNGKYDVTSASALNTALQTVSHLMGTSNIRIVPSLLCTTANNGWSIGDYIDRWIDGLTSVADSQIAVGHDSSNAYMKGGGTIAIFNKGTGANASSTSANFKMKIVITRNF